MRGSSALRPKGWTLSSSRTARRSYQRSAQPRDIDRRQDRLHVRSGELLTDKGIGAERLVGFNKGGTVEVAGVRATMTKAEHSSTYDDGGTLVSLGEAIGYLLRMENGFTIYHTGDTAVTYDMLIVGDLYQPDLTILPIGDYFTMDPRQPPTR